MIFWPIDSVEALFTALIRHAPNKHLQPIKDVDLNPILIDFQNGPRSDDPDYRYLLQHSLKAIDSARQTYVYFFQQLSRLAVSKPINRKDKSDKAIYLRLFRWTALGSKAESRPDGDGRLIGLPSTTRITVLARPANCSACGKADANMRCPGCNFNDEKFIVAKTVYCNKKCLQDHLRMHEQICECRKAVYRATVLLDHIFMAVQEATFISSYFTIHMEGSIVYYDRVDDEFLRAGMTGRRVFVPFPKQLAMSADIGRAGMCKKIELVTLTPVNALSPSDEEYVMDLAAAQLGWKEILAPWDPWCLLRANNRSVRDYEQNTSVKSEETSGVMSAESYLFKVRSTTVTSIVDQLSEAQSNTNTPSFYQVFKYPTEDYEKREGEIKDIVRQKILLLIKDEHHKEGYRLMPSISTKNGARPSLCTGDAVLAREQAPNLKDVWISDEEYERLKNSGENMSKIWFKRLEEDRRNKEKSSTTESAAQSPSD
ncbi:hypothetical protein F4777DRAFT_593904 [Nemania sp. FL0916]|nr:hypothetical protein F4777DRAFT_593904 [Nemania sp. FL0916]